MKRTPFYGRPPHPDRGGRANEAGDQFGIALGAGDFNDDGFEDLAVGTPGERPGLDPKAGAVKLIPAAELAP